MTKGITFQASFYKAQTLVDGGWRISFDLDKDAGITVAQVAALEGELIQVGVVPLDFSEVCED